MILAFGNRKPNKLSFRFLSLSLANVKSGVNITLEIDGHNQQIITTGSLLDVQIMERASKNTWRRILAQRYHLCNVLGEVLGDYCPIKSGVSTELRNLTVPAGSLTGHYHVLLDAYTAFREHITCIHTVISL